MKKKLFCLLSALVLASCGAGGGGGDGGDGDNNRITVDITEASATVALSETFQFHVTVTNTDNKTVTWKVNDMPGGNNTVGTISDAGLYTAPVTVPDPNQVTVKAVSVQDISCSDTAAVTISGPMPPDVQPRTVTVAAGATQQFTANMPVTWSVEGASGTDPATWGTISDAGVYTAPLSPPWLGQVQVVGVSKANPALGTPATVTVTFSNATLHGRYAVRYRGTSEGVHLFGVGSLNLDGHGAVTAGRIDFLRLGTAAVTGTCAGTYALASDGRGAMALTVQPGGGGGSFGFGLRFAMSSGTSARVIGFDDTGGGWGNLDLQDTASFGTGISGRYSFQLDGLVPAPPPYLAMPLGIVGTFHGSGGTIDSGTETINDGGAVQADLPFTGTYTSFDAATGRGTATLDAGGGAVIHFAYYLLMPEVFAFVSMDVDLGYVGVATQPDGGTFSNSALDGPMVFFTQGFHVTGGVPVPTVMAGVVTADAAGGLADGVMDLDIGNAMWTNVPTAGTYAVAADGKAAAALSGGGWTFNFVGYVLTGNYALILTSTSDDVLAGQFIPRSSGMGTSTLRGSWSLALRGAAFETAAAIHMTLDGNGNLTGTADVNKSGALSQDVAVSGTYSLGSNGRGEATITIGASTLEYALYAASGRMMVFVPRGSNTDCGIGFAARLF